jgi:hypothetical protein
MPGKTDVVAIALERARGKGKSPSSFMGPVDEEGPHDDSGTTVDPGMEEASHALIEGVRKGDAEAVARALKHAYSSCGEPDADDAGE